MKESDRLTENELESFAKSCASSYCRRFNCWTQLDDASQESALFLWQHRDKWSTKTKAQLRKRTIGQLIRNYQNEKKLRTKSPLVFVSREDFDVKSESTSEADQEKDRAEKLAIIERALRQPDAEIVAYKTAIREVLAGTEKKATIAARHGISPGRLSQVFSHFTIVCKRLALGESSELIDTSKEDPTSEELASMPLFYQ